MPFARPKCYPNHIPTSNWEKIFLTVSAGITALINPQRDDMVAMVSETTSTPRLHQLRLTMLSHPVGRELLRTRPEITSSTVPLTKVYPTGSLGEAYAKYMRVHGFQSDLRCPVHLVDDPELAYILTRYRQIHDFLHAVTGIPATVQGELLLKWFEFCNLKLPMPLFASIFGGLVYLPQHDGGLQWRVWQWGLQGHAAECVLNIDFEKRLHENLDSFRREFRIPLAPVLVD